MNFSWKIPKLVGLTFILVWGFVLVLILSLGTIFTYITFKGDTQFLQIKQAAVASGHYLPGFYCHIFASSVILIVGFLQFMKWVYRNRPLHKALGKIYVFGVVFFASPGAFAMTFFINRGTGVFISFIMQNCLWMFFTVMAWVAIKKLDINKHVHMMRRSYALAFAAINLRFYIYVFHLLGISIDFPNNYLIIAFTSWVPNLIVAELLNRFESKKFIVESL